MKSQQHPNGTTTTSHGSLINLRRPLLVAVLALAGTLVAKAATIVVPSGSITTIQQGIDAAFPGDTVLVAPGTYGGSLAITTPDLTLMASGELGSVKISGRNSQGSTEFEAIAINAEGVVVRGFEISGFALAIEISADDTQITGNVIRDTSAGIIAGSRGGRIDHNRLEGGRSYWGVIAEGANDLRIDHNIVSNYGEGITVYGESSGVQVDHNVVNGCGNGIVLDYFDLASCGNVFEKNTATGNYYDLSTAHNADAPCNVFKNNRADTALPSLSLWDVR